MVSVLAFSVDDPSSNPGRSLKSLLFVYLDVDVVNICYLNIERTKDATMKLKQRELHTFLSLLF